MRNTFLLAKSEQITANQSKSQQISANHSKIRDSTYISSAKMRIVLLFSKAESPESLSYLQSSGVMNIPLPEF
jgi:hypothetical protein